MSNEHPKGESMLPAKVAAQSVMMTSAGAGAMFLPRCMSEVVDFAQLMARAGPAVPPAFRGQPGVCLAVSMQALRWEMDPFAVAQKAYVTIDKGGNERIAYEAQLIAAVVNTRGPFDERPQLEFVGAGDEMMCIVTATIRGETRPRVLRTPKVKDIGVKNSPLWKSDREQQLAYYGLRSFGRRYCPEVLMGVYDQAEFAPAREPRREDYRADRGAPRDGITLVNPEADEEAQREADRLTRASMPGADLREADEPEDGQRDLRVDAHGIDGSANVSLSKILAAALAAKGQGSPVAGKPEPGTGDQPKASAPAPAQEQPQAVAIESEPGEDEADVAARVAEELEATAIAAIAAMTARYIDGLKTFDNLVHMKDFAARAKANIDGADGVPAAERARQRGLLTGAVLERERQIGRPKGGRP